MNWLDKAISYVSPEAGMRRARSRAWEQAWLNYDAANIGRRAGSRINQATSGNAEIAMGLVQTRNNAWDLNRNNGWVRKAGREWAKTIIGYGAYPRARTGVDRIDQVIDRRWDEWMPVCCSDPRLHWNANLRIIVKTQFIAGEVLVRLWDRSLSDGLPVPFQIQVIEADCLDFAKNYETNVYRIINGVQFNRIGKIEGYWIFPRHPGDVGLLGNFQSKFVPADQIIYHGEIERAGDARTVSRLAAAVGKFRDVTQYSEANIAKKRGEACITAAVISPDGPDGSPLGIQSTDSAGRKIEELSPGMVAHLSPGQDIKYFAPTSDATFVDTKKNEVRDGCVALDMPYDIVGEDPADTNYSSSRMRRTGYVATAEEYRYNWLAPQVIDPIYRKFVDVLAMMGEIPEPVYTNELAFPPIDILDRTEESKADENELRIGKITWPQFIRKQGLDPEKQLAEIEAYKARLDAAGVTFTGKEKQSAGNNAAS